MYHHFDRKNQLFIMRYIPSHLHEILWSKMPSGGGFSSKPLSHLQCLKDAFTTAPVLCYWAPDLPMMVEMDTSDQVIATILSVTTLDTEICPVAISSHSLQGAEQNYDTHDKELLAIYQAYINW